MQAEIEEEMEEFIMYDAINKEENKELINAENPILKLSEIDYNIFEKHLLAK